MIVLSIIEIVGGQPNTPPFAEYHIDASNGFEWRLVSSSPIMDKRLYFQNKYKTKAGDRLFQVFLDDPNNELSPSVEPELLAPNKESGLCLQSQRTKANQKKFEFFRTKYDKQTKKTVQLFNVCLVDELIMDSCLVLQLSFPKKDPIIIRFPIFVQPEDAVKKRYRFMQKELEAEGLYSFIYDELHGVFSTRRISLEWKEGSTALSQEDSWVERNAIHKTWDWMFSKAIPAILHAPAYNINSTIGLEQISRVHRPPPSMLRKQHMVLSDNSFVIARGRRQDFAIPAHVVIVSFLKRINLRLATICDDELTAIINDAQNRKAAEKNKKFGVGARGALRSIEGEIEDLKRIVSEERAQFKRMKDDLRRLESTQVFKESFALPVRSVFDVAPACFSFNNIYQAIRKRIIDFDSQHYNWHARANSTLLRVRPIDSTQDPGESVYQWKYSKVYQDWCYYHFVRAALAIGLRPVNLKRFGSDDESWISFETRDSIAPVRISLFHEVKGYAQNKLWKLASKPLRDDEWCVGACHDDDEELSENNKWKYLTPDFVLKIEGALKKPFLIVLDAKSFPWGKDHIEAQRKYRSFCQYLKGYQKGSILDPASLVQTMQSWIICPNQHSQYSQDPSLSLTGSSWSIQSGRVSFSGEWNPGYLLDTSKVGLGCFTGDPSIGVKNEEGKNSPPINYKKPFEEFLRMQIDYYLHEYPATIVSPYPQSSAMGASIASQ